MRKQHKALLAVLPFALALQGCPLSDSDSKVSAPGESNAVAVFNPAAGAAGLPFPIDLVFAGTTDGSINIPDKPNTDSALTPGAPFLADPQTALNTTDGFSNVAPIVLRFSVPIDRNTIDGGIRIFTPDAGVNNPGAGIVGGVDQSSKTVVAVGDELTFGVDFIGIPLQTNVLITPLRPLKPNTTHLIVLTDELKSAGGQVVAADQTYQLAKLPVPLVSTDGAGSACDFSDTPASLGTCSWLEAPVSPTGAPLEVGAFDDAIVPLYTVEQIRLQANVHEQAAVDFIGDDTDLDNPNITMSFGVSAGNVGGSLAMANAVAAGVAALTINPEIVVSPPASVASSPQGAAEVYIGTLENMVQFVDPTAPNSSVWEADGGDFANTGDATLDALCSQLDAASAQGGSGSDNLVRCNAYKPDPKATGHSVPVIITRPTDAFLGANQATCGDLEEFGAGLPVVIYQHGITSNRATLIAMADALANACMVGVAIDLPKHGIRPGDSLVAPNDIGALSQGTNERLVSGADASVCQQDPTNTVVDDGTPTDSGDLLCASGDNFINLTNLANARDTIRQGVIDLQSLYRAISEEGVNGIGVNVDTDTVHFAGLSLGAIVGMPFVAQQSGIDRVVLNAGGGGIARLLDGSPSFEPAIVAGLSAAAGISKPGGDYEGFMIIAQAMLDSADPINFAQYIRSPQDDPAFWLGAAAPAMTDREVLFQEVVGLTDPDNYWNCSPSASGPDLNGCPDLVVPNNVHGAALAQPWGFVSGSGQTTYLRGQNIVTTPAPLSGTDPLVQGTAFAAIANAVQQGLLTPPVNPLTPLGQGEFTGMALPEVGASGGAADSAVVRYIKGSHSSLLDPTVSLDVTTLMQTHLAGFLSAQGIQPDPDAGTADQVVRD